MQTVIKVLGIAALIWIGFTVLGWVLGFALKLVFWALVIGVLLALGSATYAALRGGTDRKALLWHSSRHSSRRHQQPAQQVHRGGHRSVANLGTVARQHGI